MLAYLLKRILLMIPTLIGVITLTFVVIQFVPGGPVEQMMLEMKGGRCAEASGGGAEYRGRRGVDPDKIKEIQALYGFDKPPIERYFLMLKRFARLTSARATSSTAASGNW
jgi:microcin C transport system permease protein